MPGFFQPAGRLTQVKGMQHMDLGNAIALGSLFVTVGGVLIAWICSKAKPACSTNDHCSDHSGVQKAIENLEGWMESINDQLKGINTYLRNGKGQ